MNGNKNESINFGAIIIDEPALPTSEAERIIVQKRFERTIESRLNQKDVEPIIIKSKH